MSPPARVVWIEIIMVGPLIQEERSPPARVVWIEIGVAFFALSPNKRRHPRGWCGLKFSWCCKNYLCNLLSPPARVVWIEIRLGSLFVGPQGSPPARVVWIEMSLASAFACAIASSPPARVVWIEIN